MSDSIPDFKIAIPERLPFLESICWQVADVYKLSLEKMLSRYERGWEYRDLFNNLNDEEIKFISELAKHYNSWLQCCL